MRQEREEAFWPWRGEEEMGPRERENLEGHITLSGGEEESMEGTGEA